MNQRRPMELRIQCCRLLPRRSDFRQTGRLDEVEALCEAFAARWPDAVRSFVYGHSAEGRPMRALLVSRAGALTPQALQRSGDSASHAPGGNPSR